MEVGILQNLLLLSDYQSRVLAPIEALHWIYFLA